METLKFSNNITILFDRENELFKKSFENYKTNWILTAGGQSALPDYLKLIIFRRLNKTIDDIQMERYGVKITVL